MGTMLELSKRVEVLEKEDFLVLVIVDAAGELDLRNVCNGGLPSTLRMSLGEDWCGTGVFLFRELDRSLLGSRFYSTLMMGKDQPIHPFQSGYRTISWSGDGGLQHSEHLVSRLVVGLHVHLFSQKAVVIPPFQFWNCWSW